MKKPKQLRLKELAGRMHSAKTKADELRKKMESEKDPRKKRKLKLETDIQSLKALLAAKQFEHLNEFEK